MAVQVTGEEVAARRAHVVELRRQRLPWDAIGAELGVSAQRAHQIYRDAVDRYPVAKLDEHRQEEGELIDRAVRDLLAIASDDRTVTRTDGSETARVSSRTRVEAWSAIRGWSEHRARLFGLNAPTRSQVDVVTHDSFTEELQRLAAELGEATPMGPGEADRVGAALASATAEDAGNEP
jgi:hypothetical protein